MFNSFLKEPFRLLFILAYCCLGYGCLLWIFYGLIGVGSIPIERHANLFVGGFITYFISGFISNLTYQKPLSGKGDSLVSYCLIPLVFISFFAQLTGYSIIFWFLTLVILILLLFILKVSNTLNTFEYRHIEVFLPYGLFVGIFGTLFIIMDEFGIGILDYSLSNIGKTLFYDVMVTSFLIGCSKLYDKTYPEQEDRHIYGGYLVIFFTFAVILEATDFRIMAHLLYGMFLMYIAIEFWQIQKIFLEKHWNRRIIKFALSILVVVTWILVFTEKFEIHIKHLKYIGSFCLFIFISSTDQYFYEKELAQNTNSHKKVFLVIGLLTFFAALTRSSAIFLPDSYARHLSYAAIVLLSVVFVLGYFFGKQVICKDS